MKIGIITFHWATNYGAILQTFALQTYLTKLGHEVSIINYRPRKYKITLWKCIFNPRFYLIVPRLKELIKEKKLDAFRRKYLTETVLYESLTDLQNKPPLLDVYITGSDQVWNPFFTTMGEGATTSTYFLDFGEKKVKRIAYAVSFGCEDYPEKAEEVAKNHIQNFCAVSVRENSGLKILNKLGFEKAIKLPDPTLLLRREDYNFESLNYQPKEKSAVVYILRNENSYVNHYVAQLNKNYKVETIGESFIPESVELWINKIKNASFVITNSFHGVVFSLIFHVPFIVTLSEGEHAGMNDRFYSLLAFFEMEHRICFKFDIEWFESVVSDKIDWNYIDLKMLEQTKIAEHFFSEALI